MSASELARKIAEKLFDKEPFSQDQVDYLRAKLAAIIEPEVRELVEKLRLAELALDRCRGQRNRTPEWFNSKVAKVELLDGAVFTRHPDGSCTMSHNGYERTGDSVWETLGEHYVRGGGPDTTQPKEPETK